jgi:hypothetical protein
MVHSISILCYSFGLFLSPSLSLSTGAAAASKLAGFVQLCLGGPLETDVYY